MRLGQAQNYVSTTFPSQNTKIRYWRLRGILRNCPAGFRIAIQIAYLNDFGSGERNEGPCTEKIPCNEMRTQPHPAPRVFIIMIISSFPRSFMGIKVKNDKY